MRARSASNASGLNRMVISSVRALPQGNVREADDDAFWRNAASVRLILRFRMPTTRATVRPAVRGTSAVCDELTDRTPRADANGPYATFREPLFEDLVGEGKQRGRDCDAECLSSLQVDNQFVFGRL